MPATMSGVRVAYVTRFDARDVASWSGISRFMTRALEQDGIAVEYVGPLGTRWEQVLRAARWGYRTLGGTTHDLSREPIVARGWARAAERALRGSDAEAVLSPDVPSIAALRDERPRVLWTGATFAALVDYYDNYSRLSARTLREARRQDAGLVRRCEAVIYASDWARESAIADYGADPDRVHVVPFGANLEREPSDEEIDAAIRARPAEPCRLLFLGVDWARKGGDVALDAARELNGRGLATELTVIGCEPVLDGPAPDWLRPLGFVSKRTPEGWDRLAGELARAHFLILPTRAEAYGIAFCEAGAFGTPCLASDTGGVPTIVRPGRNGELLPLSARGSDYADAAERLLREAGAYEELARGARREYLERLSWARAGAEAGRVLRSVTGPAQRNGGGGSSS